MGTLLSLSGMNLREPLCFGFEDLYNALYMQMYLFFKTEGLSISKLAAMNEYFNQVLINRLYMPLSCDAFVVFSCVTYQLQYPVNLNLYIHMASEISAILGDGLSHTHYGDLIMGAMASQITSVSIVYSTLHSGADQRKHQSSASLAFVWGIYR